MANLVDTITKGWCGQGWKSCTKLWNYQSSPSDDTISAYFLNIWCQPSQQHPIPVATAKVWFLVQKKLGGDYTIAYRFETQEKVTVLDSASIKELSTASTSHSQSSLEKTMIYIMNAKLACPSLRI